MAQGEVNLAGPVKVFSEGIFPKEFEGVYITPARREKYSRITDGAPLLLFRRAIRCTVHTNTW